MSQRLDLFDWPSELELQTPEALQAAYESGYHGAVCDPETLAEALDDQAYPDFGDAAHAFGLAGTGEGKMSLAYQSYLKLDPQAFTEAQTTGDCVSHYVRNALDVSRAVEIVIKGDLEDFDARGATEPIYGHRGHSGQGANCGTLVDFVSKVGGLLVRKDYPELGIDLTKYNAKIGMAWGGRGVPQAVKAEAGKHKARYVSRITSLEQARDAIANGYGCGGCSGYSFSNKRDEFGQSERTREGWAHAMAWSGFDDSPETVQRFGEPLVGINQSWGSRWNSGGWNQAYGPPVSGMFWVKARHAAGMIKSGQIIAIGDFDGFKRRVLPRIDIFADPV